MDAFSTVGIYLQRFLKHRNNFPLVNWKFYKGDINSAESSDKISEERWQDVTFPESSEVFIKLGGDRTQSINLKSVDVPADKIQLGKNVKPDAIIIEAHSKRLPRTD